MSLIKDVKHDLSQIDTSRRALQRFSGTMLAAALLFILIGNVLNWKITDAIMIALYFIIIGFLAGFVWPVILKPVYKAWMIGGLILGWFVSRLLLIVVYYFMITPVGFLLRLFGKKVIDTDFSDKGETYWIKRDQAKKTDYTKLF